MVHVNAVVADQRGATATDSMLVVDVASEADDIERAVTQMTLPEPAVIEADQISDAVDASGPAHRIGAVDPAFDMQARLAVHLAPLVGIVREVRARLEKSPPAGFGKNPDTQ
jgi:hypothetical protein